MSSREPMWYCHECHAEMRPLMVPDPHCASCNGTFVEKLENLADDPRDFMDAGADDEMAGDNFLFTLQNMLRTGAMRPSSPPGGLPSGPRSPNNGGGITIHVDRSSGNTGSRMVISGGPVRRGSGGSDGDIPTFSEYMAQHGARPRGPEPNARGTIEGPLMLQYLLTMLQHPGAPGGRGGGDALFDMFGGPPPGAAQSGRWGDYVFNQEALDEIISQIMESSHGHPVAATEEIISKLPREVLEEESPLLEKDCAICKDQFSLKTDDPDEQIVVTLPCKHPFHEPCIIPWLKSSGTCPVCRYQLVPQPEHHSPNPGSPSGSSGSSNNRERSPSGSAGNNPRGGGGGLFDGLFTILSNAAGPSNPTANANNRTNSTNPDTGVNNANNTTSSSNNRPRSPPSRRGSDRDNIPGAWYDVD